MHACPTQPVSQREKLAKQGSPASVKAENRIPSPNCHFCNTFCGKDAVALLYCSLVCCTLISSQGSSHASEEEDDDNRMRCDKVNSII